MGYYEDLQRFKNNISFSSNKYPTRVINGNQILEQAENGDMIQIGSTIQYCNELEDIANQAINKVEEYKNILLQHGLIEIEKTPEDIAKEQFDKQQEIIQKQSETIDKIIHLVGKLEKKLESGGVDDGCRTNDSNCKEDQSENSQAVRAKSAKNKSSGSIVE